MSLPDALEMAVDIYRQGKFSHLEELCRGLLPIAPDHPDVLHLMALALHGLGRYSEAVEPAAQAAALYPDSSVYCNSLAILRASAGDYVGAEADYRFLLSLQPATVETQLGLAHCLIEQDRILEAERELDALPGALTSGESIVASLSCERIGLTDKALTFARAAYRNDPHALEVRLRLAEILGKSGEIEEAKELLEACLEDERVGFVARLDLAVLLHRSGAAERAVTLLRQMLEARPTDTEVLSYLGALLVNQGRFAVAEEVLRRSLRFNSNQPQAIFNHALALHKLGYLEAAVEGYRRALALDELYEDARTNLLALLAELGERGVWSDLTTLPAPEGKRRQLYVLCFPKSGSTFLCTMLEKLTGLRMSVTAQGYFQNEQELDRNLMFGLSRKEYIVHQHCRATVSNVHLLQAFGIKPIILVRNLPDALVSMVDYLSKGAYVNTFFEKTFQSWSLEKKLDAVIARYAHWYIEFFASWTREQRKGAIECCFVHYEDVISDKIGVMREVIEFLGLEVGLNEVERAVSQADGARKQTLFNKGVAGRGRQMLSYEQMQGLERLAGFYPDIDFRAIGLLVYPGGSESDLFGAQACFEQELTPSSVHCY